LQPSTQRVREATRLILELFQDFEWRTPHDLANYLGFMVTPLLRPMLNPPYMGLALNAHQPGSGKTLLGNVMRTVHGGVLRSEMPHDEAELGKSVAGILAGTTAPVVEFDNVTGVLKSGKIASLLTTAELNERVLGTTNATTLVNNRIWIFNGNNISLGGDLTRRIVWATLESNTPNPQDRDSSVFKIPDLSAHAARYRGQILAALLTWCTAWAAAGSPVHGPVPATDYGRWLAPVRTLLELVGVPGTFLHKDSAMQTEAVEDDSWGEFIRAVKRAKGTKRWSVADILARPDSKNGEEIAAWRDIIHSLPGDLNEKYEKEMRLGSEGSGTSRSLGKWLQNRKGRWASDMRIQEAGEYRSRKMWQIEMYGKQQS
jgi:hypothetical protein